VLLEVPMPTIPATPGRHIALLPAGAPGDPIRSPAVRIRCKRSDEGGEGVVVYLPEVKGLIDALAWAAAETAELVVRGERRDRACVV
jgi:hypothetical protein